VGLFFPELSLSLSLFLSEGARFGIIRGKGGGDDLGIIYAATLTSGRIHEGH